MSNRDKGSGDALLAGLLFGLISGAIFALLYTPKSGRELREDLKAKTEDLPTEVNNLLNDIRELYDKSCNVLTSLSKEQYGKLKDALGETQKVIKNKLNTNGSAPQEAVSGAQENV